jgi:hypothetical protein
MIRLPVINKEMFYKPPKLGTYTDIVQALAIILAILLVSKESNEVDKVISSDVYNLAVALIIIWIFAFISMLTTKPQTMITFLVYTIFSLILPIMILSRGSGKKITGGDNAIAIITIVIIIYYFMVSGLFKQLVSLDITDTTQSLLSPKKRKRRRRSY